LDGKASLFGGSSKPDLAAEVSSTMGTVLEETLVKNMQLQDALAVLGQEVEDLRKENARLKAELERTKTDEGMDVFHHISMRIYY